ncbi:MAG TPA: HNH endonuclease signature motif containing protein, partial [Ktedonobacteraceae bacterium]|nr:HNH endonuclease signature motif containing protein [Ktedonobacteraceae bacterium]
TTILEKTKTQGRSFAMSNILRPSVMIGSEWYKERDQQLWRQYKQKILQRDAYTCSYCRLTCQKFMQVNHIGAEDDHHPENLETVCPACHSVLHLGASALEGSLTVFECKPELTNLAEIVMATRKLLIANVPWADIQQRVLKRYARPDGEQFGREESIMWANKLLASIVPPAFRAYLPEGYAVLFHEVGAWQQFPERVWKWQIMRGSHYRKEPKS